METGPKLTRHYYTAMISRPGEATSKATNISRCLKPAWAQAVISSVTRTMTSWTVRTRRSNVLSFLSFHKSQQMRTTKVSKPRLQGLGISFRECSFQYFILTQKSSTIYLFLMTSNLYHSLDLRKWKIQQPDLRKCNLLFFCERACIISLRGKRTVKFTGCMDLTKTQFLHQ